MSCMTYSALTRYLSLGATANPTPPAIRAEKQNSDYESAIVQVENQYWRIRTARITPTKPGAFLACWTRDVDGRTVPFSAGEKIAGLLVFVQDGERFGVFRFTQEHLRELGITTSDSSPGKRGFRVYPSWCTQLNPQAQRTQRAQSSAFSSLI